MTASLLSIRRSSRRLRTNARSRAPRATGAALREASRAASRWAANISSMPRVTPRQHAVHHRRAFGGEAADRRQLDGLALLAREGAGLKVGPPPSWPAAGRPARRTSTCAPGAAAGRVSLGPPLALQGPARRAAGFRSASTWSSRAASITASLGGNLLAAPVDEGQDPGEVGQTRI